MLLVTGITGHTGRCFLQELINNKYQGPIRCIVRETSDTTLLDNSGLNIEKVIGSLDDVDFIYKFMDGVDVVMHIYNIHHSPVIVESAIENGVKRVILVHTTGIYSGYKYASEGYKNIENKLAAMTKDADCPTKITILRPSMIYGDICDQNISKFIWMIDKFRFMPVIDGGKNLIQPVNARDLGKAFFTVFMSPEKTVGKEYNLSGDKPIEMIEIFNLISKKLGKRRVFINVPLSIGVFLAKLMKWMSLGKLDYLEQVQRMGENRSYSHEDALIDFGYSPMNFEVGLQMEVNQYLDL